MQQTIRLFCLPFAGGNSFSYRSFQKHVADVIKILAIDLPGHGKLLRQPLLTDLNDMADFIVRQIKDELTRPYAIYGHSMGTLLGYIVSKKLFQAKMAMPMHLFFSGRQGPSIESQEKGWHLFPRQEFIAKVMAYGGIPREIAAEPDLMDLFVPIMKADFQALSVYQYEEAGPLETPITVMIGEDEDITYAEALTWQAVTTQAVTIHQFSGGHFFIFNHLAEIGHIISCTLREAISKR